MLAAHTGDGGEATRAEPFVCATAKAWRAAHPGEIDALSVIVSDTQFHGNPGDFQPVQGLVTAPVAFAFEGFQEIVDVATSPPAAKVLRVEGHAVASWAHAASLHRELRYVAVALVRRKGDGVALSRDARLDATAKAGDLEEHALQRCRAWTEWVAKVATGPRAGDQVDAVLKAVMPAAAKAPADEKGHDVCAALRASTFTEHQAHVLSVMAMREMGIPAYGLVSGGGELLVAAFVDDRWTWRSLATGKERDLPPIVARAPIASHFDAVADGFWLAQAGAFEDDRGRPWPRAWTVLDRPGAPAERGKDTTSLRSLPLREVCP